MLIFLWFTWSFASYECCHPCLLLSFSLIYILAKITYTNNYVLSSWDFPFDWMLKLHAKGKKIFFKEIYYECTSIKINCLLFNKGNNYNFISIHKNLWKRQTFLHFWCVHTTYHLGCRKWSFLKYQKNFSSLKKYFPEFFNFFEKIFSRIFFQKIFFQYNFVFIIYNWNIQGSCGIRQWKKN